MDKEYKKKSFERKDMINTLDTFENYVTQYYQRIYLSALGMLGNVEDAKELTQVTFINAYKSFSKFQKKSSFYTWLYSIFLHHFYNHLRKKKKYQKEVHFEGDIPLSHIEPSEQKMDKEIKPSENLAKKEEQKILLRIIRKLPEKLCTVIIMKYFDELSIEEIALILKCREGTVKSRLFNARALLKERLIKKNEL